MSGRGQIRSLLSTGVTPDDRRRSFQGRGREREGKGGGVREVLSVVVIVVTAVL